MELKQILITQQHKSCYAMRFIACLKSSYQISCIIFIIIASVSVKAQIFRGYSSGSQIEFSEEKSKRRETIKGYYPDGNLEFVVAYRNSRIDGDLLEYHENGILKAEIPYDEGKRDGVARFYHENGILMCKIYYEDGEETGRAKFYDSNGYLTASVNLDKNRLRQGRRAIKNKENVQDDTE
jgi:hypothetical protein